MQLQLLPKYVQYLATHETRFLGLQLIRYLSQKAENDSDNIIASIIQTQIVPSLLVIASDIHYSLDVRNEASWILINISFSSKNHCDYLITKGLLPFILKLLANKDTEEIIQNNVMWIVQNIVVDDTTTRDYLLSHNVVSYLNAGMACHNLIQIASNALKNLVFIGYEFYLSMIFNKGNETEAMCNM